MNPCDPPQPEEAYAFRLADLVEESLGVVDGADEGGPERGDRTAERNSSHISHLPVSRQKLARHGVSLFEF